MSIDHCLLLSAGFGTRMGVLGKILPKVLWPIFNKRIIELEIAFAKSLGCRNIYINSHFLHEQLREFIVQLNDPQVTLLFEKDLLGSGGAIHNLVRHLGGDSEGTLLTINSDQFFLFEKELFDQALVAINDCNAIFFGLKVNAGDHYNKLVCDKNVLQDICPNDKQSGDYVTYSGLGLINLKRLKYQTGESAFFETVANFKRDKVLVFTPEQFEYWDFGTIELYHQNILELTKNKSKFSELCRAEGLKENDHFCDLARGIINLGEDATPANIPNNSVFLDDIWEEVKK